MKPCGHPQREKPIKDMKDFDNHKVNNEAGDGVSNDYSLGAKIRAFIAGLTPSMIFKYTFFSTVLIALAATIIYHTATDSKHVNINKVDTATVVLTGSDDLGGISAGGFKAVEYSLTNNSTAPAYVFVRIEEATSGLYEVVDTSGWVRVTAAEGPGELIYAFGELGNMTPVGIGEEVVMSGRLHCLADAVMYSGLSGVDLDIDVEACLVYGTSEDGGNVGYNTGALSLWERYIGNK